MQHAGSFAYSDPVIEFSEYDPGWSSQFEALRQMYVDAFLVAGVPVVSVEHVGSTSVPGLAAKPIIDCDIVVAVDDVNRATAVMVGLGFVPLGELGIPLRWAFTAPPGSAPTHTYVVVDGCLSLRNHLAVRDTLRADPALCERYAAVKRKAAASSTDIEEYGAHKNDIIQEILTQAGLSESDRASIDSSQVPSRLDVPR